MVIAGGSLKHQVHDYVNKSGFLNRLQQGMTKFRFSEMCGINIVHFSAWVKSALFVTVHFFCEFYKYAALTISYLLA
jgi:hypothetical protein